MAIQGPQNWTGHMLHLLGLLGVAAGLGTLAYQGSFWWFDGDWEPLPFDRLWTALGGDALPLPHWPGAETAIYWLTIQPLSSVLLISGAAFYVLGRVLGGG